MKKLLLLMLLSVSSVGIWAQGSYYKFTSNAVDKLYTDVTGETKATFNVGDLCTENYFVQDYEYNVTAEGTPATKTEKVFSVKTYYVKNDGTYSLAWNLAYNAENQYATLTPNALDFSDAANAHYTTYLDANEKLVFTSVSNNGAQIYLTDASSTSDIKTSNDNPDLTLTAVQVNDVFDNSKVYVYSYNSNNGYVNGILYDGSGSTWSDAQWYTKTETVVSFKETAIGNVYVENDGVYTAITSNSYTEGNTYYTLSFTDIPVADNETKISNQDVFNTTETVVLDGTELFYSEDGITYVPVVNGEVYKSTGAYYTKSLIYVSKTPAELYALNYVNSVSGLVTKEVDGKTLTLVCVGDVCDPGEAYATEGYKFQANANNVIFKDQEGTSVAAGSIYVDGNAYYTRAQKYAEVQEIPTTTKYQLAQFVYVNNAGRYDVVNSGTDINDITYYINSNAGEEFSGEIAKTEVYKFKDSAKGWIYIDNGFNNISEINVGDVLDSEKAYVVARTQWQPWNGNYDGVEFEALKNGEYAITSYVVDDEQGLYTKDGSSYVPAAGTIYDEGKTYYSGVTFSEIENIKENEEYATPVTSVNPGSTEYFVRTGEESNYTYTPVYSGTNYDASATYCIKDGFDYSTIDLAALQSGNYVQSETVASNYWEALVNEINANGYETVVFKTADGEPKATICNHVTHAMMKTTTVNALDFMDVQIDELVGSVEFGGSGAAIPHGTFVNDDDNFKDNNNVTILLLPEIKNANSVGHKHVPTNLAVRFPNLQLIVMPNNATCVEHDAFSNKQTIKQVILNDGLKMIGHDAFSVTRLNVLTIPESVEYIGYAAFGTNDGGGYLHDVYFLGKKAPIVEMDAFGSKAYLNNNAYLRNTPTGDARFIPENWRKDRSNYVNADYMMAMLHFRTDLTEAERAAFTDVSRDFHVFDLVLKNGEDELVKIEEASTLKSAETLVEETVSGNDKSVEIYWSGDKSSSNLESIAYGVTVTGYNKFDVPRYNDHQQWENASGFYDKIVGHQYRWPNQADYSRSYAVATHNLLWNGKTTIAGGITGHGGEYTASSYDSDCDGEIDRTFENGNEYIGLHQFVLVTGDVSPNTTPQEWEFSTIGGKNWWSICVPVDMTVAEVREAFGENTQVCKFDHVTREPGEMVKFFFTDEQCYGKGLDGTAIMANYPYMIHPSSKKGDGVEEGTSKFTLPRYELSGSQIPVVIEKTAKNGGVDTEYTYKFIGQYNTNADGTPLYMPQYSYFLGNAGNDVHRFFFQTGTTGKWKPFTCVIIPSDGKADYADFFGGPSESKVRVASSVFGLDEYDEATSISNYQIVCGAENNTDNAKVYNLNGQLVGKSLNGLSRGVYIVNGQKHIVR